MQHLHDNEIVDPKKLKTYDSRKAHIKNFSEYEKLYKQSIKNPEAFWNKIAKTHLSWFKTWSKTYSGNFSKAENTWFKGAKLNLCYNALDRHLRKNKNKIALHWVADNPNEKRSLSYQELFELTQKISWILKREGLKKGDRVTLYMPMIPELVASVLACARLGLVHSVIFGGFSPNSIRDRLHDADSKFVITADCGFRGGKIIELKKNVDEALKESPDVKRVLVFKRNSTSSVTMQSKRDFFFDEVKFPKKINIAPAKLSAEDPLFILYTSGSTGKPKGVLHTQAGYGVYTAYTFKILFDYQPKDVFFCTADVGWITGHSYLTYGPLFNAATCVMFEGIPTYPDGGRYWDIIDQYKVTSFYTSPTALRSLMRLGDEIPKKYNLKSLRLLGSVGEPINPEAWRWYFKNIGRNRCPIIDTWWQTETGGVLISPLPRATPMKPGSGTLPFFGIEAAILNEKGEEIKDTECEGLLAIKKPWPSIMRGVYNNPTRFYESYFKAFPGYYFTGDAARRDKDGYYWITGRVDDVLNVSGHRLSTAEIESALVLNHKVAEAAVVGYPHDIKGQGVYCFVTLKEGIQGNPALVDELRANVAKEIGAIAKPDIIQWAPALPKTRSGKIMRRILRKIASKEFETLGDTSTLADPSVVDSLIKGV
jgi:acetyl-CoA synthetase